MDLNKGVPTLFAYCEKLIWKIFFKFKHGTCPWMAFARKFFGIFMIYFLGGSVRQIIYREHIVFRGSNISCSLAIWFWGYIVREPGRPLEHFSVSPSFCLVLPTICRSLLVAVRVTRNSRSVTLQSQDPPSKHFPHSATSLSWPLESETAQYTFWSLLIPSQVIVCCFVLSGSLLFVHDRSVYAELES